jgi:hypothetical protein
VAGRYRLAVRVQDEEDGEYTASHVLVYGCGKVIQASCMNVVTEIQEEVTDPVRCSRKGETAVLKNQLFSETMRVRKFTEDLILWIMVNPFVF